MLFVSPVPGSGQEKSSWEDLQEIDATGQYFVQQWEGTYVGEAAGKDFVLQVGKDVKIDLNDADGKKKIRERILKTDGDLDAIKVFEMLSDADQK